MAPGPTDRKLKLVTISREVEIYPGDDVTIPCHLSPPTSAVAMEIRWFKGTECVYLYRRGHVTEGRGYEGRFHVDGQELQRGDVSLRLWDSDEAYEDKYTCQLIRGQQREEKRLLLKYNGESGVLCVDPGHITDRQRKRMEESVKALISNISPCIAQVNTVNPSTALPVISNISPRSSQVNTVSPSTAPPVMGGVTPDPAQKMEELVEVTETEVDMEMEMDRLTKKVNKKKRKMETTELAPMARDHKLKLVTISREVEIYPGDDVTIPCHLSPPTSAVAMEIRWFKGTECVYLYRRGHVTEGRGYEGRFHVDGQELQRGDVSLRLWDSDEAYEDKYTCQLIRGQQREEKRLLLKYNGESGVLCGDPGHTTDRQRKRMEESVKALISNISPRSSQVNTVSPSTALPVISNISPCIAQVNTVNPSTAPPVFGNITSSSIEKSVCDPTRATAVMGEVNPDPAQKMENPPKEVSETGVDMEMEMEMDGLTKKVNKKKRKMETTELAPTARDHKLKLVTISREVEIYPGDDVTIPCHLSPPTSAVAMEIRWFKGTECVYLYRRGHVTEGRGYEGRFHVDGQELQRGDVSLRLWDSDEAYEDKYTCQLIRGQQREEKRLLLKYNGESGVLCVDPGHITDRQRKRMEESVKALISNISPCIAQVNTVSPSTAPPVFSNISPRSSQVNTVSPSTAPPVIGNITSSSIEKSVCEPTRATAVMGGVTPDPAQNMEGLVEVTETGVDMEMEMDGLTKKVNKKKRKMETTELAPMARDHKLKLVTISREVEIYPGDDVTIPCHLSPPTSAVAMEIRWFKGTECVYLYRRGHVTEGRGYEGRFHVDGQELQRGDVSLRLWDSDEAYEDKYTCQLIRGQQREEKRLLLKYNGESGVMCADPEKITDRQRKRMDESVEGLVRGMSPSSSQRSTGDSPKSKPVIRNITSSTQRRAVATPKVPPVVRGNITSITIHSSAVATPKAPPVIRDISSSSIQRTTGQPPRAPAVLGGASSGPAQRLETQLCDASEDSREAEERTDMERLKEEFEKEKRDLEARHREQMEELRRRCEREARAEAERNLVKVVLPEVKQNIRVFKAKIEEEFRRQTGKQRREVENGEDKAMSQMMNRFSYQVEALLGRIDSISCFCRAKDIEMGDIRESLKREIEKEGGGFHRELEAMENDRAMNKKSRLF
ncbi:hypothetical protein ACEWY4_022642 [Coilia grayii]|uniref:Ig-like domain-containing protein n=1 Tax=Coilia grayii TaxID=363190 RepID=A0ABD1J0U9_9TELE